VEDLRAALNGSTSEQRAEILLQVVRATYEHVKFHDPEGFGLDGRDGPERLSLGGIVDLALKHSEADLRPTGTVRP